MPESMLADDSSPPYPTTKEVTCASPHQRRVTERLE
jgi:hypothetical protein